MYTETTSNTAASMPRLHRGRTMDILTVEKHSGSGQWFGEAVHEGRRYKWYYRPRGWLHVHEQDERNPRCWMNISPTAGMRTAVLKAVRTART